MKGLGVRLGCVIVLLTACLAFLSEPTQAANDTTFYSRTELSEKLLTNVVRISTLDIGEHGFGLVVGAQARDVFIATARHVVVPNAKVGRPAPMLDSANRKIEVIFCSGDDSGITRHEAQIIEAFDAGGNDIALLRVPRPVGYTPQLRALAADAEVKLGHETWLLGQEQQCGMAPRIGAIAGLRDSRENLRIEFPGALGGDSGGPAVSGYGVLGLVTDAEDLAFTVFSIASLEARLRAQSSEWWQLEPARNIPLTDPRSAEIDLTETLSQYIFNALNVQQLLQRPKVPRKLFTDFTKDYNTAVTRFRDARERHDGTLKRHWPEGVLEQWEVLRDQLWQAHQTFWSMNAADSQVIFDQQKVPPSVQIKMQALEPVLVQLQTGIAVFLKTLTQGVKP